MAEAPVFRKLVDVENNSKYYMMLLRVRETELERCTKAYEDIQATLKCCLTTNSKLKDRIEFLEQMLNETNNSKRKEIELYKKQIAEINKTVAEVQLEKDTRLREMENVYKRNMLENERMYVDKLNKQEIEFDKRIDEMMVKFQRESVVNSKLKNDLDSMMNINVGLKSKIHLLQSKHSSDKSLLEVEVAELKDANQNINGNVAVLRHELDRVLGLNEKFKQVIIECQEEIQQHSIRLEDVTRLNNTCKRMNSKLNDELCEYKKRNKKLKRKLEEEVIAKAKMREEIDKLKIIGNVRSSHGQCNIPEHENYIDVKRQNAVLQEIVKNMRRERNNKENECLRQAENNIERIESVIEDFKKSGLFNTISLHNSVQDVQAVK